MWLRFNKVYLGNPQYGIVWVDKEEDGQKLLNENICTRCIGPHGPAFGESAPEDILSHLEKSKKKK